MQVLKNRKSEQQKKRKQKRGNQHEDHRKTALQREMCRVRMVCLGLSSGWNDHAGVYPETERAWKLYISGYAEAAFFKIDSDYYMIKGIQGNDYFRIAVHGKHEDQLGELEESIIDCMEK